MCCNENQKREKNKAVVVSLPNSETFMYTSIQDIENMINMILPSWLVGIEIKVFLQILHCIRIIMFKQISATLPGRAP